VRADGDGDVAEFLAEGGDAGDVVAVAVGKQDAFNGEVVLVEEVEQALRLEAGVDEKATVGVRVGLENVAVCFEIA